MQVPTPSLLNISTPEIPTEVDPQEARIMEKTFASPRNALNAMKDKSIETQMNIIKKLGRNAKQKNDDSAKETLRMIADNEAPKIYHPQSILIAAKMILDNIEGSEGSEPESSSPKPEENDDVENDKKE